MFCLEFWKGTWHLNYSVLNKFRSTTLKASYELLIRVISMEEVCFRGVIHIDSVKFFDIGDFSFERRLTRK